MKRGYSKKTYHQRSKDETVFSVVKRTMGDEVRSIGVKGQNNEMRLKIISYNAARIASLARSLLRGFLQSRSSHFFKYSKRHVSALCRAESEASWGSLTGPF